MAKIDVKTVLDELEESFNNYMAAISKVEDIEILDENTKQQASSIIQRCQIHSEIALETISN
ncbi:MAG: hypothetical protein ACTSU7_00600 [Candidatus Heimdallarchaeaceae archaeon]